MTVAELIELLREQPQDLQVAYASCSEHALLIPDDISRAELCEARPDGWIQNKRPDMPTTRYLILN